jgi:hypothetical protein
MAAPQTDAERNDLMYSDASIRVTDPNGHQRTVDLSYNLLFKPGDVINGKITGTTVDAEGHVITDDSGRPFISTAPDSNSLVNYSPLK